MDFEIFDHGSIEQFLNCLLIVDYFFFKGSWRIYLIFGDVQKPENCSRPSYRSLRALIGSTSLQSCGLFSDQIGWAWVQNQITYGLSTTLLKKWKNMVAWFLFKTI